MGRMESNDLWLFFFFIGRLWLELILVNIFCNVMIIGKKLMVKLVIEIIIEEIK